MATSNSDFRFTKTFTVSLCTVLCRHSERPSELNMLVWFVIWSDGGDSACVLCALRVPGGGGPGGGGPILKGWVRQQKKRTFLSFFFFDF